MSTGCTSSTDAIGYAARMIRDGDAEVLLTGGADACVTRGMMLGFARMRALSTGFNDHAEEASRPFERDRDGFVLGEGAWMFVLELEDRARARGATVYAAVEGYASTCDGVSPCSDGPPWHRDHRRHATGCGAVRPPDR